MDILNDLIAAIFLIVILLSQPVSGEAKILELGEYYIKLNNSTDLRPIYPVDSYIYKEYIIYEQILVNLSEDNDSATKVIFFDYFRPISTSKLWPILESQLGQSAIRSGIQNNSNNSIIACEGYVKSRTNERQVYGYHKAFGKSLDGKNMSQSLIIITFELNKFEADTIFKSIEVQYNDEPFFDMSFLGRISKWLIFPTLDQLGIIANLIAGILMGLDFFIRKESIETINSRLEYALQKIRDRYLYKMIDDFFNKHGGNLSYVFLFSFLITYLILQEDIYRFIDHYSKEYYLFYLLGSTLRYVEHTFGTLNYYIDEGNWLFGTLAFGARYFAGFIGFLFSIFMVVLLFQILSYIAERITRLLSKALSVSPKGALGSIAVIMFILGNTMQLLATLQYK